MCSGSKGTRILAAGLTTRLRLALIERRLLDLCDAERVRVLLAEGDLPEARRSAALCGLGPDAARDTARNDLSRRLRAPVPALLLARQQLLADAPEATSATLGWLLSMQRERLTAPRLVEIRTLDILAAMAQGHRFDAAALLSDLAYGVFLSDYSGLLVEQGPDAAACLSRPCAIPDIGESKRGRVRDALDGFDAGLRESRSGLTRRKR